ncbi:MAG: hypothetical protein V1495_05430 [Pseudomonadota bacterium]
MNEPVLTRWLFLRRATGERLVRARFFGRSGTLTLTGEEDPCWFVRLGEGRLRLTVPEALAACLYEPGVVLWRSSPESAPEEAPRRHLPSLLTLLIVCLCLLWIVRIAVSTSSAPRSANHPHIPVRSVAGIAKQPSPLPMAAIRRLPVPVRRRTDRRLLTSVLKAFTSGDLARAEAILETAEAGNDGRMPYGLRKAAREVRYAACRQAFERGNWGSASRACERTVREFHHAGSREILSRIEERARRLFLEGYVMEDRNPSAALRRYREVLSIAPAGGTYRSKAAEKLRTLARTRTN